MGLFHKKLSDVKKFVKQGKYDKAMAVLEKHIKAEHSLESDLSGLQAAVGAYQHSLRGLQQGRPGLIEDFKKKGSFHGPDFDRMMASVEISLRSVEALIMKLRKDAKLELE